MNYHDWMGKMNGFEWVIDYITFRNKIDSWINRLSNGSLTDEQIPVVKRYIGELIEREKEFIEVISNFKYTEHEIMKLRYVDGMKLDDIADRLDLKPGLVAQKHSEITKPFKKINGMTEQFQIFKEGTKSRNKLKINR